jgi:predicted translin family RNA/ssDNA-binding protein
MIKNKTNLNKNFKKILQEFNNKEKNKQKLNTEAKTIIKISKKTIYAIQRKSFEEAKLSIKKAEQAIQKIKKQYTNQLIKTNNLYKNAIQEYAEAKCFYEYIINKKIPTHKQINIDSYNYLAGLSDFTGELTRYAVLAATNNNHQIIKQIHFTIDYILSKMMLFNFSNGELRRKYDAVKWNLKKVENILYDISMKRK